MPSPVSRNVTLVQVMLNVYYFFFTPIASILANRTGIAELRPYCTACCVKVTGNNDIARACSAVLCASARRRQLQRVTAGAFCSAGQGLRLRLMPEETAGSASALNYSKNGGGTSSCSANGQSKANLLEKKCCDASIFCYYRSS